MEDINYEDVNNINTVTKLKKLGFEGVDCNLEIALYEYGLVWKVHPDKKKVTFVYGVVSDDTQGDGYSMFARATQDITTWKDFYEEFNWADMEAVATYSGMPMPTEGLDKLMTPETLAHAVDSLLAYYGWPNVFTSSPYTFPIAIKED